MSLLEASPEGSDAHHRACDELGRAINEGKIGEIVAKHEKLILQYYRDVQTQAQRSFNTARMVAQIGFYVLIGTLVYALIIDGLTRYFTGHQDPQNFSTVARLGAVSGALIEFIAGVTFCSMRAALANLARFTSV